MLNTTYIIIIFVFYNLCWISYEKAKKNNSNVVVSAQIVSYSGEKQSRESEEKILKLYKSLQTKTTLPSYEVFKKGIQGYLNLESCNKINKKIITVIDFSLPSSVERLWVIDLNQKKILFNTLVAHGRNSGHINATSFSNTISSLQSSLGFYITNSTYIGKHGLSLLLEGVEKGINDNALARAIVMHGAAYVSHAFIKTNGYLGRSFGCPAVPEEVKEKLITDIAGGSCLFIYHNDNYYNRYSKLLKPIGQWSEPISFLEN